MNQDFPDFSSISPSALAILEARSFTSIRFAKEAFKIISMYNSKEDSNEKLSQNNVANTSHFDFGFRNEQLPKEIIKRIMHFEARYLSINKGLRELNSENILEFSSGFSLRGLDFCENPNVLYLDADLPEIIHVKMKLLSELVKNKYSNQPNNLILKSMNILNEEEFTDAIGAFNTGKIDIVNEGLLMYLNSEQKENLCRTIHSALSKLDGFWITADIYIRDTEERKRLDKYYSQNDKDFVRKHNIDNNKFENFSRAKEFFSKCGFEIYKRVKIDRSELSSNILLEENYPTTANNSQKGDKMRETWILRPF